MSAQSDQNAVICYNFTTTILLDLTPEQERNLRERALRLGTEPAEYLRRLLDADASAAEDLPKTPAEAVAYWKRNGLIGPYGDPAIDAPQLARHLRRGAITLHFFCVASW